mmetsp:Transcript_66935/g.189893  ORF Transcript_66935/g.189893 Transcript_66935/m.189893 type:complete len:312 (+) Transcript_66935:1326-2261(+)
MMYCMPLRGPVIRRLSSTPAISLRCVLAVTAAPEASPAKIVPSIARPDSERCRFCSINGFMRFTPSAKASLLSPPHGGGSASRLRTSSARALASSRGCGMMLFETIAEIVRTPEAPEVQTLNFVPRIWPAVMFSRTSKSEYFVYFLSRPSDETFACSNRPSAWIWFALVIFRSSLSLLRLRGPSCACSASGPTSCLCTSLRKRVTDLAVSQKAPATGRCTATTYISWPTSSPSFGSMSCRWFMSMPSVTNSAPRPRSARRRTSATRTAAATAPPTVAPASRQRPSSARCCSEVRRASSMATPSNSALKSGC